MIQPMLFHCWKPDHKKDPTVYGVYGLYLPKTPMAMIYLRTPTTFANWPNNIGSVGFLSTLKKTSGPVDVCWRGYYTHTIHGTGIFTYYMNGWFLMVKTWFSCRVNIPVPWMVWDRKVIYQNRTPAESPRGWAWQLVPQCRTPSVPPVNFFSQHYLETPRGGGRCFNGFKNFWNQ